jgi:hypothetical protein
MGEAARACACVSGAPVWLAVDNRSPVARTLSHSSAAERQRESATSWRRMTAVRFAVSKLAAGVRRFRSLMKPSILAEEEEDIAALEVSAFAKLTLAKGDLAQRRQLKNTQTEK